jgi:ADP-ribose pyrophosphatase YjhB (NUDIX family)
MVHETNLPEMQNLTPTTMLGDWESSMHTDQGNPNGPVDTSRLLHWARKVQALAQTGLAYTKDPYDKERYESLRLISADILTASARKVSAQLVEAFTEELGYATPKVDVRAAVFADNRVLLVKERSDGRWTLPGGWADIGESPGAAVVREVKEESGYIVVARKLAAVYDRDLHGHPPMPFHVYKLFFLCDLVEGAPQTSTEIEDLAFFPENELPPLSLARVTPKEIAHLFEHQRHPEWPTSFD